MNLSQFNNDANRPQNLETSSKSLSDMDVIKTYEKIVDESKEQTIEMAPTEDQNKGKSRNHDGTRMTNHMNINETKSPNKNQQSIFFVDGGERH